MGNLRNSFVALMCRIIADRLPKKVVYYAGVRLWANATTGKYSCDIASNTTIDDALARWE